MKRLRKLLSKPKGESIICPKCDGVMKEQKTFPPDPYWDIVLVCQRCGAISDGAVIYEGQKVKHNEA